MFPSSQICFNCGNHRHKMPLFERVFICPECGHTEDRDYMEYKEKTTTTA